MKAEWQYLLVERMEAPTQTQGGLFLPSTDQDPLHMVRVVSIGSGTSSQPSPTQTHTTQPIQPIYSLTHHISTGLVGESGVLTQIPNLAAGDVAVVKQPWGIGPRDELWDVSLIPPPFTHPPPFSPFPCLDCIRLTHSPTSLATTSTGPQVLLHSVTRRLEPRGAHEQQIKSTGREPLCE